MIIIRVGRSKVRSEYEQRLAGGFKIKEQIVSQSRLPSREGRIREEGERILKSAKGCFLVVLDEHGKRMKSVEFAHWIQEHLNQGDRLCFVIGGPDGVSDEVKEHADCLLQLSDFTLQHDLAYLVLVEQLYRAQTIIQGQPYHRE
ncbi:MAG: 23S rRNA (pseudouridine(1915)-N(3))-methyltransferase RlmH [bacterium]